MKAQNYNYYIVNIGEDGEEAYQAIIPKFPNLHVFLDPIDNMHEIVMDVIDWEIKERKKDGRTIPKPDKKPKFNGKILLRISPELHEKLYIKAKARKMSLNKYIERKLIEESEKTVSIKKINGKIEKTFA